MEAAGVDEAVDALAHGELALGMLPRDALGAAHLVSEFAAAGQFVDLGLPGHRTLSIQRSDGEVGSADVAQLRSRKSRSQSPKMLTTSEMVRMATPAP